MKSEKLNSLLTIATDYLPLAIFFIDYKLTQNLVEATIYLLISTAILLTIQYIAVKRIAPVPLFSAAILGFFGGMTILLQDEIFIKMKPTIVNLLFAAILFFGYFSKKPLLSYLFGGSNAKIVMKDRAWLDLSFRWAVFFIALAILNEIIWRNFTTEFWVGFKVFGMLPLTFIFMMTQIPFMLRNLTNKKIN